MSMYFNLAENLVGKDFRQSQPLKGVSKESVIGRPDQKRAKKERKSQLRVELRKKRGRDWTRNVSRAHSNPP